MHRLWNALPVSLSICKGFKRVFEIPLASLTCSRFELFFSRVQSFLPLLHRSKLYTQIFDLQSHAEKQWRIVDIPTALLLNSMFALSARFSNWDHIWTLRPAERGATFFQKAQALWSQHVEDLQFAQVDKDAVMDARSSSVIGMSSALNCKNAVLVSEDIYSLGHLL
jgi:hypothetical protein